MSEDPKQLMDIYHRMVAVRQFEEMAGEYFSAGEIPGFIHLSIGQEASSCGVCSCLRSDDYVVTTHRGHGHMVAKGADLKRMTAELFGKSTGFCKGKGGSMHIFDFSLGILGANGVVAGGLPIIAGAGYSIKMRKTDQVAVAFFGDGASNRGPVHEAMNMAAIWKLPILFVLENNQWASTTPQTCASAIKDLYKRSAAYGMTGLKVDGNDVLAVRKATVKAVARARKGEGPTLIEIKTYRMAGHFVGDQEKYRTREEVAAWKKKDPINRFGKYLIEMKYASKKDTEDVWKKVAEEISEALVFAKESPSPRPEDALEDLYATNY
jgi:pyruvate dehydrogenase E1 component alpha subunit